MLSSLSLFKAMTRYPTLERLPHLVMPTLVIAGDRDPLVDVDRVHVFAGLPHVEAVRVHGAHALNHSDPTLIAALIEAHLTGQPLSASAGGGDAIESPRDPGQSTNVARPPPSSSPAPNPAVTSSGLWAPT